jgi:hypothetical protein
MSSSLTGPYDGQYASIAALGEPLSHHNIVSVSDPATECLEHISTPHPVPPSAVYYAVFEQRPSKQDGYEQYGFCGVEW